MKKYYFSSWEYQKSHGKTPRGTGHWAFIIQNARIEGISTEVFFDKINAYRTDTIFWVPGICTLTEAKKKASKMMEVNGIPDWANIDIAP